MPDAVVAAAATGPSAEDIKKSYLRVLRAVHPDKVVSAELPVRLEAQRVFSVLSEAYQAFQGGSTASTAPASSGASTTRASGSAYWEASGFGGGRREGTSRRESDGGGGPGRTSRHAASSSSGSVGARTQRAGSHTRRSSSRPTL